MSDRLLIPLPDGRWLALEAQAFSEALVAGAAAVGKTGSPKDEAVEGEALVDAGQIAKDLSLPVTWIEQKAREGFIPSIQAGRWRRFKRSAVERSLSANGKHA